LFSRAEVRYADKSRETDRSREVWKGRLNEVFGPDFLSSLHEILALVGENDVQEVSMQAFWDYVTTSGNTSRL
jgi:hypothetical protein